MTAVHSQPRLAGAPFGSGSRDELLFTLNLGQGKPEVPWIELGRVVCGARRTALLKVVNDTQEPQVFTVEHNPREYGFHLFGADIANKFTVQPGSNETLRIQWAPLATGSVRTVLRLLWGDSDSLQVVLSGTAMAGSAATVTAKSSAEACSLLNFPQKGASNAGLGDAVAHWSIPAARPGAEAATRKLPALSKRGGLKHGTKLDLVGTNVKKTTSMRQGGETRRPSGDTKQQAVGSGNSRHATGKSACEAAASPKKAADVQNAANTVQRRPGLRQSERSIEGVTNASRPAGPSSALRLYAGKGEASAVTGVRTQPAAPFTAAENPAAAAGTVKLRRPKVASSAWPETDVSARKTFSFAHKGLWLEKQEKAFGVWLNAALAPPPPGGRDTGGGDGGLAAKRLEARVRGALWHLYCGDATVLEVVTRLEKRIDEGFLRLKPEEARMGDMRTKQQVAEVLSAYHPFWLRLGLEVVVGKPVPEQAAGSSQNSRAELEEFARVHFLGDADLALQRAGNRAIVGLHSPDYWVELGQLVLKRFLLLALLLDRAVAGPKLCPKGAPLLFRRGQPTKSSAEAVEKFLRGRMHGEGDVMRHLAGLGFRLAYEQDPRTEFDFGVASLATDLRSGVRLLRLTELLTGEAGLVQTCHFPAERRSLRLANAQRAFAALCAADAIGIRPHSAEALVDGDREATLSFLWTLFLHFQLPALLDCRALAAEIARVQAMAPQTGPGGGGGPASHPVWPGPTLRPKGAAEAAAQLLDLLLRWARTICGRFNFPVRDLKGSFADGRALCYLVNFYMPWMLPAARISHVPDDSADLPADEKAGSHFERPPWIAVLDEGEQAGPRQAATRRNFELLAAATARLGGIPTMLTAGDCCAPGGPHEQAVIGHVGFLCARLLEVSCEERAAHTIQRHWRMSRTRQAGGARAHLHAWMEAARDIQAAWRAARFRERLAAGPARRAALRAGVVRLQALWRRRGPRQLFLEQRAAVMRLQAVVRGWRGRRWVLNHMTIPAILQHGLEARQALITLRLNAYMGRHATKVQAIWRGAVQRRAFLRQRAAAVQLQAAWRGFAARRALSAAREATLTVQRMWRGFTARSHFHRMRRICICIQSAWRCHSLRSRFLLYRSRVVAVQALARHRAPRRHFVALRRAAVLGQKLWRGHCVRHRLHAQKEAAIKLQAWWRQSAQRQSYMQLRAAAICIQSHQRRMWAQQQFRKVQWAAAIIQKQHRGWSVRRGIARQHAAATCIKAHWQMHACRSKFLQTKRSIVLVQSLARMQANRRKHLQVKKAAVCIQQHVRGWEARRRYAARRAAAVTIQAHWRAARQRCSFHRERALIVAVQAAVRRHIACTRFVALRSATITVQAHWRGREVREEVARQRSAALTLQKHWRTARLRRAFQADVACIVLAQAALRRWTARQRFLRLRAATIALQAAWRGRAGRLHARKIRAAVVLQRHARGWALRRSLSGQHQAAVSIQSAWRAAAARRCFRAHVGRVVLVQAACRGWAARAQLRRSRAAATTLQSVWRGRCARQTLRCIRAAVVLQKHARGRGVRLQVALQAAAAVRVQAAWRMHAQRRRYLDALRCIVRIQAACRGRRQRATHLQMRAAAILVQLAWRANRARRLRRRNSAAVCIQSHVRGHQQREEIARMRAAAVAIQAAFRMHIQRSRYLAMLAMQEAMKEMYRTARTFARRTAAAVKLQAAARGFLARCEFRRRLAAKHANEAAAMRVIAPWALTALTRTRFLALRRATIVIQRCYRRRHVRRTAAAAIIQTSVRRVLAQSEYRQLRRSAVCIQARWRGSRQRRRAGKSAAAAARRLRKALASGVDPRATLAARTAAALHVLQQCFHVSQVMSAFKELQHCIYLSAACAESFVNAGGASSMVHCMRSCNRSAPHMGLLKDGLAALGHAARRRSLAPAVYAADDGHIDCPSLMAAIMLQNRDNEEVYMSAMAILLGAVGCPERAAGVAGNAQTVKQLESLGQLLIRKLDMESKYLNRLEGEKGSDVSAREATRKMVAARRQLLGLHQVLTALPGVAPAKELAAAAAEAADGLRAHAPRNTIVRSVLKGLHR